MQDLASLQQRAVDRYAGAGIALTLLAAIAFLALDPVQTVSRPTPLVRAPAAPPAAAVAASAPDAAPFARISLPEPVWRLVGDAERLVYARTSSAGAHELVLRDRARGEWAVAYRAPLTSYIGQFALARGVLVFEEIAMDGSGPAEARVVAIRLATRERALVDRYAPVVDGEGAGYVSAAPRTDGTRLFWIHQRAHASGRVVHEVRTLDLATGEARTVLERREVITSLEVWRDVLAITLQPAAAPAASVIVDLPSGTARDIDGLAYAYVRAVGPAGVIVNGGTTLQQSSTWLIAPDGARTQLGSGCATAAMSERALVTYCDGTLAATDLDTNLGFHRFSPDVATVVALPDAVAWTEGTELFLYPFPAPEAGPE